MKDEEMFQSVKDLQKPNYTMKAMGGGCASAFVVLLFLTLAGAKGGIVMLIPAIVFFVVYKIVVSQKD